MSMFEIIQRDVSELVNLVRESERYCAAVAARPELASTETHDREVKREHRIAELSHRYGVDA